MVSSIFIYLFFNGFLICVQITDCAEIKGLVQVTDGSKTCETKLSACSISIGNLGLNEMHGQKGDKGEKGLPGLKGLDGIPGLPGLDGLLAPPGADGRPGADGVPGKDGLPGHHGADGVPGHPGAIGFQGLKGERGPMGQQGPLGPSGSPGVNGYPGPEGERGPIGKQGPLGRPGHPGENGLPGPKGEQGFIGKQGPSGLPGLPGASGLPGLPGPKGEKGVIGKPGPLGPPGKDGVPGSPGAAGSPGMAGPEGKYGFPGLTGIEGPKGDVGPPGIAGLPGSCKCLPGKEELFDEGDGGTTEPDGSELRPYSSCQEAIEDNETGVYWIRREKSMEVFCNKEKLLTCLHDEDTLEKLDISTIEERSISHGNESFWLSERSIEIDEKSFYLTSFYNKTMEEIEWLLRRSSFVFQKIRYHCKNSYIYPKGDESKNKALRLLTWKEKVIGPHPTDDTPFFYSIENDQCKDSGDFKNEWRHSDIELRSTTRGLPIMDFHIRDIRMGEDQRFYLQSVQLCFG